MPAMLAALPLIAPWTPMVVAGGAGLLVVALAAANPGSIVFKLQIASAAVAASAAWLLDDPAAETLASSPTPLVARRGIRMAVAVAFVAVWWVVTVTVATSAVDGLPASALLREVAVLTALAILGSVAAQRRSTDGRGGSAGALVAIGWFALSFLPRVGAVPLPPDPLRPGTSGALLAITGAAAGLALLISSDPARRGFTLRPSRRG